MTQTRALQAWERHKGICVLCNVLIDGVRDDWYVEHIRALELGGKAAANKRADGLENALHKLIRGAVRFRAGADQFLGWNASHPHLKLLIEALEEAGVALAALKEPKP
jgi:hypothetical protein